MRLGKAEIAMPLPLDELVNHPELVNRRAQALDWEELLFEYELAVDDMQAWLHGLDEEQIHFKPAEKVFSIAEVVTHNSFSDEMFWSWVLLLAQGRDSSIDPRTLISGDGARNTTTRLDLEAQNEACRTLARHTIDSLPPALNLVATAAHPYFGALNGKGWIYFMAVHRGMHRYQCESVIDTPGFPRSSGMQSQPREVYQPSERKTWLKSETGGDSHEVRRAKKSTRARTQRTGSKKQDAGSKGKNAKRSVPVKKRAASQKKAAARSK